MSHVPHDLARDFPDLAARISELKASDKRFAHLAARYDEINREVHRVETFVQPMDSLAENDLRKERALLKDALFGMLTRETA